MVRVRYINFRLKKIIDQNEHKTLHERTFYLQAIIVDHYYYCLKPTFDFRTRLKIIKKGRKKMNKAIKWSASFLQEVAYIVFWWYTIRKEL